jgi:tetratricopeptide (TPR) repeat protein
MRVRASLVLAVALVSSAACDAAAPERRHAARRPVLLVGIDAADWLTIEPLAAQGRLPTFARLLAGQAATLTATPPLVSPLIWTTIATGRHPEDHGVLDFMLDLPAGGQAPVSAASRRVAALWNVFSDRDRRVAVIGWWATWPAEDLRGTMVSDRVAPQLLRPGELEAGLISPASEARRMSAGVLRPEHVSFEDLARYVPLTRAEHVHALASLGSGGRAYRDRLAHLAAVIAATRTYADLAEAILRSETPDLTAVYFEVIDTVSHLFVADPSRGPRAIEAAYRDVDALVARLAAAAPPDSWVVVVSDHGFYPRDAGITENPADLAGPATAWHRPYGIAAAAEARWLAATGPVAKPASRVHVTPLDIAPTVLHAASLPVSLEMPGRVVPELVPPEVRPRPVERVEAFAAPRVATGVLPERASDPDALERLKALGYVGATTTSLARLNLGEALYRRGKLEAAERELRGVVDAQPGNLSAQLWLGRTLADQGRARQAFRVYAAALRLPGGVAAAAVATAESAVAAGELDAATLLFQRPGGSSSERAAACVARAVLAQARGRNPEVKAELQRALAADPLSFDALSRLVDLAIASGRPSDAMAAARAAAARAPRSPRHLALLGETLLAAGQPAESAAVLERALALAPDSDALRLDLARARVLQGDGAAALAVLDSAAASQDRSALRGAAFTQLERWADAASAYRDALGRGNESAPLLNGLAWAELRSGRRDEAARLLERSLATDAAQPRIRRLLSDVQSGREPR